VKRRLLGRTDLAVSEVGFGGWAIGGNRYGNSYGPTDDAESIRAVQRAVEHGCNFFDTADVYGHGHSEEILGEALAGVRRQVIIATKVGGNFYNRDVHPLLRDRVAQASGVSYAQLPPDVPLPVTHDANFSSDYVRFALGRSLERLRTDYVDLLQLHNPPLQQITTMETYGVLEDLKKEGLIRAYGISVHTPEEGLAAITSTMPDTVQVVYNLARREADNIGVIVREPLANGFLAGRYAPQSTWDKGDIRSRMPQQYVAQLTALGQRVRELAGRTGASAAQLALKFVLDNPAASTVIVGTKTLAQADENFDVES
jgi:myo-inositol catabolism protein IolS